MVMYAPAPPGTVFASVVIGDMVGRETPIKVWDDPLFIGTIEKAEIVDDGKAVKMIVSVRNMPPELRKMLENGAISLGESHRGILAAQCGLPDYHDGPCRRLE